MNNSLVIYPYAEQWLAEACKLFEPIFSKKGYTIPSVRALYGFSIDGYSSKQKRQDLGECLPSTYTYDGQIIIVITPLRSYGIDVLSILGHELVHAVDDCENQHGDVFRKIASDIGYEFIGITTYPGKSLLNDLRTFSNELGKFPAIKLRHSH